MAETTRRLTGARSSGLASVAVRAFPSLIAGGVAVGLLVALAWDAGGYFPSTHLRVGAIAFGTLALLLVVLPPRFELSTPALLVLAGVVGLALWSGLSSRWSPMPDTALEDMQRTLVYAGVFGLGLLAAGSGRYARHLVWAVVAVVAAICLAGLTSRLAPDVISAEGTISRFDDYRLAYPLTYWNAFGAMSALGVVLCAGLAADPRNGATLRGLAAGLAVPIGVAGYLSYSRGAWLALGVGLVVLVLTGTRRLHLLMALGLVGGALMIAILRLRAFPALTDDPAAAPGQTEAGHAYTSTVVTLTLVVAVVQGLLAKVRLRTHTRERLDASMRRLAPYAAGLALLLAGGGYVATSSTVEGGTAQAIEDVEGWVDRQWDEFMSPAIFSASGAERLTSARGSRSDLYRVAIDGFEGHPLKGDGAGGFEVRFAYDRDVREKVRDAHSLYLETAGELGLVGVVLLLLVIGGIVWAIVAARLHTGGLTRGQSAAVAGAVAVWIGHAMVDWDWQMPALTGVMLLLAAAACPVGRTRRRRRGGSARRGLDARP